MRRSLCVLSAVLVGFGLSASAANAIAIFPYSQTNLVSDGVVPNTVTDPNLKNPWGVSESSTSPLWISDQAANVATLYTVHGLTATLAGGTPTLCVPSSSQPTHPNDPTGVAHKSTTACVN